jgi:uncharacterized protein GlcG (DUF336 family)
MRVRTYLPTALCAAALLGCSDNSSTGPSSPNPSIEPFKLPSHSVLRAALRDVLERKNGGLGFDMWASFVDRDGVVRAVVFSGVNRADQWPGSRVISAQKANTANAFSLEGFALSTANLFAAVQPGGSLFGLQESNPVDPDVAYGGNAQDYGTASDPMVGKKIGGVNVFGGGLALYDASGNLVGALGVSGDTSCTDHVIAWRLRHALNLDNVPAGVADGGADDNLIYAVGAIDGFEHPTCINPFPTTEGNATNIVPRLPTTDPIGPAK